MRPLITIHGPVPPAVLPMVISALAGIAGCKAEADGNGVTFSAASEGELGVLFGPFDGSNFERLMEEARAALHRTPAAKEVDQLADVIPMGSDRHHWPSRHYCTCRYCLASKRVEEVFKK